MTSKLNIYPQHIAIIGISTLLVGCSNIDEPNPMQAHETKTVIVDNNDHNIEYDDFEDKVNLGKYAFSNTLLPDTKSLDYGHKARAAELTRTSVPDDCLYIGRYPSSPPSTGAKWEHIIVKALSNGDFRKMKVVPRSPLHTKMLEAVQDDKYDDWNKALAEATTADFVEETDAEIIASTGDTPLKSIVNYHSKIVFRIYNENWEFDDSIDSIELGGLGTSFKFYPFYGPLKFKKDKYDKVKTVSVEYYRDKTRISKKDCQYYYNINVIVRETIPAIPAFPPKPAIPERKLVTKLKIDPIIQNNGLP